MKPVVRSEGPTDATGVAEALGSGVLEAPLSRGSVGRAVADALVEGELG
jgi:hypothetical protein